MTHAREMLDATPAGFDLDPDALARCIGACQDCAQTCTACADACLAEESVADLRRCIRLDLDCADVAEALARSLSRQTAYDPTLTKALLEACITACWVCAEECWTHAEHHAHCRLCAEACEACRASCEALLVAARR